MEHLLKPLETKNLTLKNRLIMPPMATAKSSINGEVTKELLDYYDEKSKSGMLSMIIIEHSYITRQGKAGEGQLSVAEDSVIDGLKTLADTIHKNGSKCIMQINHAGSAAKKEVTGMDSAAPSAVANFRINTGAVPKELTVDQIKEIVNAFAKAAKRVKAAGFDGVEIHSAHGYLLNQFFSPLSNLRTGEYGGNVLNRIRIHLEVIRAVRQAVGEDFPVLLRLGASDFTEGGSTIEDSKIAAVEFEKAGINVIDITGGLCGYIIPGLNEQGYFSPLSEAIKKVVSIPVILTGGITEADAAENLLAQGKADLIGVGRAIMKDSDWPVKAFENK